MKRIDIEAHFFTTEYEQAMFKRSGFPRMEMGEGEKGEKYVKWMFGAAIVGAKSSGTPPETDGHGRAATPRHGRSRDCHTGLEPAGHGLRPTRSGRGDQPRPKNQHRALQGYFKASGSFRRPGRDRSAGPGRRRPRARAGGEGVGIPGSKGKLECPGRVSGFAEVLAHLRGGRETRCADLPSPPQFHRSAWLEPTRTMDSCWPDRPWDSSPKLLSTPSV